MRMKYLKKKIFLEPKEVFSIKEEIKFSDLIVKLNNFHLIFFLFFEYKKQYPDFESNYFFYLQIKYLLDSILSLNEAAFEIKILDLIDNEKLIKLIKKNKVIDKRYVDYFYYEICEEYQLDYRILSIKNFTVKTLEERKKEFKNYEIIFEKDMNEVSFKSKENGKAIKLNKYNDYIINKKIIENKFKQKENKYHYQSKRMGKSLYYFLNNLEFSKGKGDKLWEQFLKTNIVENIVKLYYKNIPSDIFKDEKIINFFKDNSYHFPLNLQDKLAMTQKEVFRIYFGPKRNNLSSKEIINKGSLWKVVDDAFYKVKLIHEWFHACQAFLFFSMKNNNIFDSPKREIIVKGEKIESDEGGETIEILLFGREIKELDFNEVLYIFC